MLIIRPVQEDDLDKLMDLLALSGPGLTSLPKDRDIIHRKVLHSLRSFEHKIEDRPMGESYLFVMEDLEKGHIVGVSGLISKLGGFDPFYVYRVETEVRESSELQVTNSIRSLHLEKIHSGPAEICSLFLSPEYRKHQNGRFLSLSRFLFIANSLKHFEKTIIAEMRGVVDENGNSPFWEAVGRKFFKMELPQADYLQVKTKKFIEDLLPTHALIVDLLPESAQEVVGAVHPLTSPARKILEQEGFNYQDKVAILEPGPILEANIEEIRTIRESKLATIAELGEPASKTNFVLSTLHGDKNFIAVVGPIEELSDSEVKIPKAVAKCLSLKKGHQLRYASLKAKDL